MKKPLVILLLIFCHQSMLSEIHKERLTINFKKNSFDLSSTAQESLERFTELLAFRGDYSIYISGHTDKDGSMEYNERLSMQRAQSVRDFLLGKGAHDARMKVEFKGERDPLNERVDDLVYEHNRRVLIEYVRYEFENLAEVQKEMSQRDKNLFIMDPRRSHELETKAGIKIRIAANSFVDSDGNPVTEPIEVHVIDALDPLAFVAEGLSTMAGEDVLVTGGMFKFEASTAEGEKLQLAEGKDLKFCLPSKSVMPGMTQFVSEDGKNWTDTGEQISAVDQEGTDFLAYPKKTYPKFKAPVFRSDYSKKPAPPYEPTAPRMPQKPVLEDYRTHYKWHDTQKKKRKEWDETRFERALLRYHREMVLYEQRYQKYENKCAAYTVLNNQYQEVLSIWKMTEEQKRVIFEEEIVAPLRKEHMLKYNNEIMAYELECEAYEEMYGVKVGEYSTEGFERNRQLASQSPGSYLMSTSRTGWTNCDQLFRLDININESMIVRVETDDQEDQHIWLVENNGATMIPVKRKKNGKFRVKKTRKATSLLVAYKVDDGQLYSYFGEVEGKEEEIEYSPSTYLELNERLRNLRTL